MRENRFETFENIFNVKCLLNCLPLQLRKSASFIIFFLLLGFSNVCIKYFKNHENL